MNKRQFLFISFNALIFSTKSRLVVFVFCIVACAIRL